MKKILVTGGAGYIGSHTVVKLIESDYEVVIIDNLSNSKISVIDRIEKITNKKPLFIEGDICDIDLLDQVMCDHSFDSVMHFAGLKAVAESEKEPLRYFVNNVVGSIKLFEAMQKANIRKIVFSSSATVYGDAGVVQYREDTPVNPINIYGHTKLMVEDVLRSLKKSDTSWSIAILRYFNPVGAHQSGLIGEDPEGVPNNLMPYISQVALGLREKLYIYGSDYPTPDGTGLRDYIHVEDLAEGHIAALSKLDVTPDLIIANLGTGRPLSVLDILNTFTKISNKKIPYVMTSRRSGDLAEYYADPSFAKKIFNWSAQFDIEKMCIDAWRWQVFASQNGIRGQANNV